MSQKSRKLQKIHTTVLEPSTADTAELSFAVEERFKQLTESWYAIRHEMLIPPPELNRDVIMWRTMCVRHRKRDFRNTRDELLCLRRVADWMQRKNCELRNQKYTPVEWVD